MFELAHTCIFSRQCASQFLHMKVLGPLELHDLSLQASERLILEARSSNPTPLTFQQSLSRHPDLLRGKDKPLGLEVGPGSTQASDFTTVPTPSHWAEALALYRLL